MADLGHRETDERLNRLERRIMREYQRASKEILKKTQEFMRKFQKEDDKMRTLVAEGKITDSQYKKWRIENILTDRRWNKMRQTLVDDWFNADKIARRMVNDEKVDVYALNHNYAAYQIERDIRMNTSFTLYNHESVERLLRDNPKILPPPGKKVAKDIAEGRAKRWSDRKLQSIMTQSILQGDSIPNIAKRLTQEMGEMSKNAAIRNARTLITGAEAAGRVDAYKQAKDMGINMKQMWLSTLDGRTRHEHRLLDGQKVEVDKPFKVDGVEIRFPGDPTAPGYLIYNCRCTVIGVVKDSDLDLEGLEGMERDNRLGDMSYEEWKEEKAKKGKEDKYDGPSYYKPIDAKDFVNDRFSEDDASRINDRFQELDGIYHAEISDVTTTLLQEQGEYDLLYNNYVDKLMSENPRMRRSTAERRTTELMGPRPEKIDIFLGGNFTFETRRMTINNFALQSEGGLAEDIERRKKFLERNARRAEEGRTQRTRGNVGDTFESTFIHEYGHAVDATYGVSKNKKFLEFYNSLSGDDITKGVSDYAGTNEREFVAECFCEAFMGETQGELSKQFMKILDEIIRGG